jgi:signal transduction histidine kinase
VFATVLALVASVPLGRDAERLEATVRRIELGDRAARTGVDRADELGHVARALDQLTERLDALERERAAIEDERRRMFASVGHDLRTPLSALQAAVEALADGLAPEPDRYLRAMSHDVAALGALIDDVFLLATIESGRLELDREPLDLSELADETVEALGPAAAAQRVRLALRSPGGVRIDGNATAIGRVLRNLVDNAIRHAPPDTAVDVLVDSEPAPTVTVVDRGPGFPTEFAGHAFVPFARADVSRTRATGGAGLGLVIARGLVEAHGGRIWIDHVEPSAGGRVVFELPAADA